MIQNKNIPHAVNDLPEPDSEAMRHSLALLGVIQAECDASGGTIPFRRYMELALYHPEQGYYAAGLQKFGVVGDFITAPEISPFFSQCLARQCAEILTGFDKPVILEVGAGSGIMAAEILLELARLGQLPDSYLIIEISNSLRQRQLETIREKAPELLARVKWLDALPEEKLQAVVLANEVLDAMPVECFQTTDEGLKQLHVAVNNDKVGAVYKAAEKEVISSVGIIEQRAEKQLDPNYQSEFNPVLEAWIASIADGLDQGVVLIIDYGYPASEYYMPQRTMGTLICHYQHRAHANPFWFPGLQDITAFVDFSAVAYAAVDADMEVRGYTTQAAFLMANGLDQLHAEAVSDDIKTQITLSQQIKTLTLPSEMGERFKVIALAKNYDEALSGFALSDYRSRL